mgnify:CR=1 FL=1
MRIEAKQRSLRNRCGRNHSDDHEVSFRDFHNADLIEIGDFALNAKLWAAKEEEKSIEYHRKSRAKPDDFQKFHLARQAKREKKIGKTWQSCLKILEDYPGENITRFVHICNTDPSAIQRTCMHAELSIDEGFWPGLRNDGLPLPRQCHQVSVINFRREHSHTLVKLEEKISVRLR